MATGSDAEKLRIPTSGFRLGFDEPLRSLVARTVAPTEAIQVRRFTLEDPAGVVRASALPRCGTCVKATGPIFLPPVACSPSVGENVRRAPMSRSMTRARPRTRVAGLESVVDDVDLVIDDVQNSGEVLRKIC